MSRRLLPWDVLFAVLVLFPLLTGGIWIRRPGLFVELSDLGIPVLLLALLAAFFRFGLKTPLEESFFIAFFSKLWTGWKNAVDRYPRRALGGAAVFTGALWSFTALMRHRGLGSNSFDLGIFTNAIWNLSHGNGYVSGPKDGMNLFADHQSPLFWVLAPVFKIFPYPETLLILQGFGLAVGAIAVFILARQYLPKGHWAIAALPLLYWIYRPFRNANLFDFHPEVFMLPLYLFGIAGIQGLTWRPRILGLLALLLGLGAKESAGPILAGIGLAWILGAAPERARTFTRRVGVACIILGVAAFYFDLRIVPKLLGRDYAYGGLYRQFGSGLDDLLLAPVLKPGLFWSYVFGKARLKFLFWTLAPLGFLPLLNWRVWPAFIPGYLMLFLSEGDHRVNITYHYAIEPGIGLFWAMPTVLALKFQRKNLRVGLWILFWALASYGRSEMYEIRQNLLNDHTRWIKTEALPCIDPKISIAAANALVPHLASRPWVRQLPGLQTHLAGQTGKVACVIDDPDVRNWWTEAPDRDTFLKQLPVQGYSRVYSCGSFQVFQLAGAGNCLRCLPSCPQ